MFSVYEVYNLKYQPGTGQVECKVWQRMIGAAIKYQRLKFGMSQELLAGYIHTTADVIDRYEKTGLIDNYDHLASQLSHIFNKRWEYFKDGYFAEGDEFEKIQEIYHDIKNSSAK